ncbi:hypothetical protein [Streptosporangium vulgare]|uniref:hypothetical protein n=1 Tax=Streptosporangium vulgare TaxID=46190 RepID=UPI0031D81E73
MPKFKSVLAGLAISTALTGGVVGLGAATTAHERRSDDHHGHRRRLPDLRRRLRLASRLRPLLRRRLASPPASPPHQGDHQQPQHNNQNSLRNENRSGLLRLSPSVPTTTSRQQSGSRYPKGTRHRRRTESLTARSAISRGVETVTERQDPAFAAAVLLTQRNGPTATAETWG